MSAEIEHTSERRAAPVIAALGLGAGLLLGAGCTGADLGAGRPAPSRQGEEPALVAPLEPPASGFADTLSPRAPASSAAPGRSSPRTSVRLAGRVVLPESAPHDETLTVVLDALAEGRRFEARAPVDAAGAFALEVPARLRYARLDLAGSWLYLERPLRVDLARVAGELELEARLGGHLLVRVIDRHGRVPPGAPGASFELRQRERSAVIDRRGQALFETLAPGPIGHAVSHVPELLDPESSPAARVRAGELLEVEWILERGASVTVLLTDPEGLAIEEARVWVYTQGPEGGAALISGRSDPTGRFHLAGLRPGAAVLYAFHPRYRLARLELGELVDEEQRPALPWTLDPGERIEGTLEWHDGRPARGVRVAAYGAGSRPLPDEELLDSIHALTSYLVDPAAGEFGFSAWPSHRGATTDAEGRFEICCLGPGVYAVSATARPGTGVPGFPRATDAGSDDVPTYTARLEGVVPGAEPISLVLQPER